MNVGLERAASSPVVFYRPSRVAWAVVHGDDLTFTGTDVDSDFILVHYEIKIRGRLGTGPTDVQSIDVLGRVVRLHSWGISWEADPIHRT